MVIGERVVIGGGGGGNWVFKEDLGFSRDLCLIVGCIVDVWENNFRRII